MGGLGEQMNKINGRKPQLWLIRCSSESGLPEVRKTLHCYIMIALEPIHQLPLREKLLVMEAIWDDISRQEQELDVPQWHKNLLDERERLLAEGKAQFVDWEEAKRQINDTVEQETVRVRAVVDCRKKPSWIRGHLNRA
jgi:hypothetical protein